MEIPGWNTVKIIDKSEEMPELDLLYAQFEKDEYIHTELFENHLSVMWSSDEGIQSFTSMAQQVLGPAPDNDDFYATVSYGRGEFDKGNPARVEKSAIEHASVINLYNGIYGESLVSWRSPRIKMIDGNVKHSEVILVAEAPKVELLRRFLGRTATPQVLRALNANFSPITEKINILK